LKSNSYDLVITDITRDNQPGDGFALAEEVQRSEQGIPVAIYTGFVTTERSVRATETGATAITSSPAELLRLLIEAILNVYLGHGPMCKGILRIS